MRHQPGGALPQRPALAKWWPAMFEANGDCTKVDWTFLGLSVPELSLIAFVLLSGIAVFAALRPASR